MCIEVSSFKCVLIRGVYPIYRSRAVVQSVGSVLVATTAPCATFMLMRTSNSSTVINVVSAGTVHVTRAGHVSTASNICYKAVSAIQNSTRKVEVCFLLQSWWEGQFLPL